MALETEDVFIPRGTEQSFDDVIGIINDSNTPVYFDFGSMPALRGGVPLVSRGDEDKFPSATVFIRATRAGSNVILMRSV